MLLLCASTLFACGDRHAFDLDTSSTSDGTPAGPEPGAPDEFCEPLDPDRVYLRHFEYGYGFMAVTDVEQPEATCLYYSGYQSDVPAALVARVDPTSGGLLHVRVGDVLRQQNVWTTFSDGGAIVPQAPTLSAVLEREERLAVLLDREGELCDGVHAQAAVGVGLVWTGAAWLMGCGRRVQTLDNTLVADPLLADSEVGWLAVTGMLGPVPVFANLEPGARGIPSRAPNENPDSAGVYVNADRTNPEVPDTRAFGHVAMRPKRGAEDRALDAAVLVPTVGELANPASTKSLQRVTMTADQVTSEGEYPQEMLSMYGPASDAAIAADGALYLLVPDDPEQEVGRMQLIRGEVGGAVVVVGEWDFQVEGAGLVALGPGRA
jgi:hypothetical protein